MQGGLFSTAESSVLGSLLGGLLDGIIITDADERIVFANGAALSIFDIPEDDYIVGRRFGEVASIVNVISREPLSSPFAKAMAERQSVGLKTNSGMIKSDGDAVYLSATCTPVFDKDGNVNGCSSIWRDITRLRRLEIKLEEKERYFRTIFTSATVGLCILNTDGLIVDLNAAAEQILRSKRSLAVGKRFGDAFQCVNCLESGCGRSRLCSICVLQNSVQQAAKARSNYTGQFNMSLQREGDIEPTWLSIFISTTWSDNQRHLILSLFDISERKRYVAELEKARQVAEAANNAKGQFLANMSHEIRTPITGMMGMIDMTLRTKLDANQRQNLNTAKASSQALLHIINDVLDFSKMESGSLKLQNFRFDFLKNIRQVIDVQIEEAAVKGLYFEENLARDLPHFIEGDPMRLRQVLHNLLNNAIKFTHSGGVTMKVARGVRNGEPTIEYSIKDTGIGMSEEDMDKLFKPFTQVDGSYTREYGGIGLGLRLVKELLNLMGGEVTVTSRPGQGSVFSLWMPCREVSGEDEVVRYRRSVFVNNQPHRNNADDNEGVEDLMSYCLTKMK